MENIKLLEITGYYQVGEGYDFVDEKSWKGKVILREDLTFEWIVVDNFSDNDFDRLVSGTLVEYNGTSLMKFSNHNMCPLSFFGVSNGKEIVGTYAVHDYHSTYDNGRCKIIFAEIPVEEDIVSDILQKVEEFKKEMDTFSKDIYESLIDNIELTVQDFIENMNKYRVEIEKEVGFTQKKLEIFD